MSNSMNVKIEKKIEVLADQVKEAGDANDALKYTQAALNLAHVLEIVQRCHKEVNQE